MNLQFTKFQQLIQELKVLTAGPSHRPSLNHFSTTIEEFKSLREKKLSAKQKAEISLPQVIIGMKSLACEVYSSRKLETLGLIRQNPDKLKLSCFELMEHNFRENTHSNVLQYLFDYRYLGDTAPELLGQLIDYNECKIPSLRAKLRKKSYFIYREMSTSKGRIDLFILDKVNRYAIVIENKVLAKVAVKESIQSVEQKTQLTDYIEYVDEHYNGFHKEFILLSYRKPEKEYQPFRYKSYKELSELLDQLRLHDAIFEQYRLLLQNLESPIANRAKLSREAMQLSADESDLPLNHLELINSFFV